ncbi:hypothetical protein ACP70R_038199 [Stipagrostis hirtigluma subsp. patula]
MAACPSPSILTPLIDDPLKLPSQRTEACEGTKPACTSDPGSSSWAPVLAFVALGANCVAAIYHSRHDPWSVAFVLASFLVLASLFYALRLYEALPRGSPRRARAKAAVWSLSAALTLMFARRVASLIMPRSAAAAAAVWAMAGSTILAGFLVLFVCHRDGAADEADEAPPKLADVA